MAEKSCEWVDREPVYAKKLGSIAICPSEYENERGARIMDRETRCKLIADPGERFCPRHKLIHAMSKKEHRA
jgi:hypothetical protein